jgi:hypothetical protein
MSRTVFSGEIRYTNLYRVGQLPSTLTRHFERVGVALIGLLLMGKTLEASPRNGANVSS